MIYAKSVKLFGEDHPDTLEYLSHLSRYYFEIKDYEKYLELS